MEGLEGSAAGFQLICLLTRLLVAYDATKFQLSINMRHG